MKILVERRMQNFPNFFNMKTATKTFKKIIEKERQETRYKISKKSIETKSDIFFRRINKAFFKQEIKEKDQDYIYREIKRMQIYRQNLVDLYGKNSQNRIISEPEPIKYDKMLLFNPYKNEENKSSEEKKEKFDIVFKEEKRKKLPFIFRQSNIMRLCKKSSSENNKGFNKSNFSEKNDKNNISRYNSINTESSSKYRNQYLTFNQNNRYNMSKISNSTEGNKFNKNEYIETLDSLYDQIIDNHKRQTRYFNSFDYGCSFHKNKCQYIYKTLFNK